MYQQSISIPSSAEIYLDHINGDLQIKGWDHPEALIRTSHEDDLSIVREGDTLRIDCRDDCSLRLPFAANIHIGQVQGNARLKFLENRLQIEQVDGSVVLRNVPEVQLNTVNGDLMAKQIAGDISIDRVQGDGYLQHLEKCCAIQKVSGNLHLQDVKGDIFASADGHTYLRQTQPSVGNCEIKSRGHIHCQLPEGIHAQVSLISGGNSIQAQLTNGNNLYEVHEKQITLGEGKSQMVLSAEGKVFFTSRDYDWQSIGDFEAGFDNNFQDISKSYIREMEAQFEKQMELLNSHMEKISETFNAAPLPDEEVERMVERARQSSVVAAQRAQEKMQRAQIKMEQKLAAAKRKAESKAGRHSHDRAGIHIQWDLKSKTSPPADEQISQDERLMILRMLEQKKISLDEAENLLRALEGEEG